MIDQMEDSPLAPLLQEINTAATNGLPFLALHGCLSLPEVCNFLLTGKERSSKDKYTKWCEENLPARQFGYISSNTMYSLRCGVIHNNVSSGLKHEISRVWFVPAGTRVRATNSVAGKDYYYSVDAFCLNFTTAVAAWYSKHKENNNVKNNLPRLLQLREETNPLIKFGLRLIG